VEQSLHSLRRVPHAFAHFTGVVRLADPLYRDRRLIRILVAFLEAAVQPLAPQPPEVVMGFAGIQSPRPKPDAHA
jgi:hypothetical protein